MRRRSAYLKSGALSEESLHRQAAAFLRLALPIGCGVIWTHVPNGGKRPRGEAGKLKAMGVRAGFSDLLVIWSEGGTFGPVRIGLVELKSEDGDLTDEQRALFAEAEKIGALTAVCRALEEIEGTLRGWLPPNTLRATLMPGGGFKVHDLRMPARLHRLFAPGSPIDVGVGQAVAASPVALGARWAFSDHRTVAEAGVGR